MIVPSLQQPPGPLSVCLAVILAGSVAGPNHAHAQFGPPTPKIPDFHGSKAKVFGEHSAFSARMQVLGAANTREAEFSGKIAVLDTKSRLELDMTQMKGVKKSDAEELKSMGMDKMIAITRPDKNATYQVWPGFKAYLETPLAQHADAAGADDSKIDITALGQETIDGHPCAKNKVVVTSKSGQRHESTVWNATDLNNFPIQIETTDDGRTLRMKFKEVQLTKPAAELFDPPAGYKRYNSMQDMVMTEMLKRETSDSQPDQEDASESSTNKESRKSKGLLRKKLLPF